MSEQLTLFHTNSAKRLRVAFQLKLFHYEFMEQRPIVYIGESGFIPELPGGRGYSTKGHRCYAQNDWYARGRVNAIGAISDFKLLNVSYKCRCVFCLCYTATTFRYTKQLCYSAWQCNTPQTKRCFKSHRTMLDMM